MKNIIQISASELENQGEFTENKNLVKLNDCLFKKGFIFDLQDKEKILKSYQLKLQDGNYLLVEEKFYFTVWVENKAVPSQETSPQNYNQINQKTLSRNIIRKYRGKTYKEILADMASSQGQNQ